MKNGCCQLKQDLFTRKKDLLTQPLAITNICQGVPTMLLLKNLIIKASFIF